MPSSVLVPYPTRLLSSPSLLLPRGHLGVSVSAFGKTQSAIPFPFFFFKVISATNVGLALTPRDQESCAL